MKVEFLPLAAQELVEAAAEYEQPVQALGLEFAAEVERVAGILEQRHSIGPKLDPIHRRITLRRFPLALIYRVDAAAVRIVAVAHHRRRPNYWRPRVQER